MPSCVLRYCTSYTGKTSKTQGVTYHSFPSDELRCIKWVDIVRKQRNEVFWKPNKWSKICSIHFKAEDKYTTDKGFVLLKKSALPAPDSPLALSMPSSPNSLAEENVSDSDPIFDTPEKVVLKKCVNKLSLQKEKLLNNNRNLKKQNKRLQKRVTHLSNILKHLKTKNISVETNRSDEQFTELNLNEDTLT